MTEGSDSGGAATSPDTGKEPGGSRLLDGIERLGNKVPHPAIHPSAASPTALGQSGTEGNPLRRRPSRHVARAAQVATSVFFPQPAGALTNVSGPATPACSAASSRRRGSTSDATAGTANMVVNRTCAPWSSTNHPGVGSSVTGRPWGSSLLLAVAPAPWPWARPRPMQSRP